MDTTTQQFIALSKKIREEFREANQHLKMLSLDFQKHIEAVSKQNTASDKNEETKPRIKSEFQIPQPIKTHKVGDDTGTPRHEWIKIGIELGTLFAVIAYAVVTHRQLKTMDDTFQEVRKQTPHVVDAGNAAKSAAETAAQTLTINQQQFRSEQRPYVWVGAGVQTPENAVSTTFLPELVKRRLALQFNVEAVNGGHSPAVNFINTEITVIFDVTTVARQKVKEYKATYRSNPGIVLVPNSFSLFHTTDPLMPTDRIVDDLTSGKKAMFILGTLKYTDIFSPKIAPYESQFCFSVHPTGMPLGDCGDLGQQWIK